MKIGLQSMALLVLAFALAIPIHAQQPPAELSIHVAEVDTTAFPQVALTVTVRDANGLPAHDLDAHAFEVNEDREPKAQPIASVEPVVNAELPAGVVLVIDISGSMQGQPLADAQAASRALVEQLGEEDEIAFVAFAHQVDLDGLDTSREHTPTTNRREIVALIDGLQAEGGTPLYDALYKGVRWAEEATLSHRAVILLTDGVDEDPGSAVASQETPIQEATRNNVPVFTIGLGNQIDRGYLERVARTTGGVYQETPDSAQLTTLFLNVLQRLKQQYVVAYESGLEPDGEEHRVTVAVEVEGRQASDEARMGPLEPLNSEPTAEPVEATATAVPEAEAFVDDGGEGSDEESPNTSARSTDALGIIGAVAGGGLLLAVIALVAVIVSRRRRVAKQEYCMGCGRALAPDEVCPDCGPDAGRFKRPKGK